MRVGLGGKRADLFFMFWIGPCVHEADGNGIDFFVLHQAADRVHDIVPIERHDFISLIVHSLADADDSLTGHERFRFGNPGHMLDFVGGQTVYAADGAHDLRSVFETLGGDKTHFAAVVGDQGIGRHGAAVFEQRGLSEQLESVHANGVGCFAHGVHHSARKIVRRSRRFGRPYLAAIAKNDHVRECAAGIDADNVVFLCRHELPSNQFFRWEYVRGSGLSTARRFTTK